MKQQQVDVIVVGGGMVGLSAAIGLAKSGLQVVVLEKKLPAPLDPQQQADVRVSAISLRSEELLQELGAWPFINEQRKCPYRRLAVWENQQSRVEFAAESLNRSHLGHILENRSVQLALSQRAEQLAQIQIIQGQAIAHLDWQQAKVTLDDGQLLQAQWIIAADGGRSYSRQSAGIGVTGWRYQQSCLAVTVKTDFPQQDITWQQFSPSGPMAFLPLFAPYASLVWYHDAKKVAEMRRLPKARLKELIVDAFPALPGDFEIESVASFPLTRLHANRYSSGKMVLLGDAAHCINPLAGQGVNLGFRDVAVLLELIGEDGHPSNEAQIAKLFERYEARRRHDNLLMMTGMDAFYLGFSNDIPPLKWARNLALGSVEKSAFLKKQVLQYAVGLSSANRTE